jgi:hypothetical protein
MLPPCPSPGEWPVFSAERPFTRFRFNRPERDKRLPRKRDRMSQLTPKPTPMITLANGGSGWKGGIPDLLGPRCTYLEKLPFAAGSHDTRHCAYFSAAAGRSTGRGISSSMRGYHSSGPRITAWT